MSEIGLKFYVGNTEILELNFHVRKREQFKEQIYKYDLLHNNEPSLKIGNEEDRWEFYRQYLSTENHWTHIAYSSDSKNMVFLNNVKFLVVYNFDSKEITGHSMVDLHGDILNMFFSHNDWVVFSNKKGQCIVLSLEFMKVKYKFVVKP